MLKFKYKKELAEEYGFSPKTLYRKLSARDCILPRGYLSPKQQLHIYECLGFPLCINRQHYLGLKHDKRVNDD
jgi:hypothetical protein